MKPCAIIGANGFVTTRMVEMFHLGGVMPLRPIVRGFSSLARLSRFALDCRIADATNEAALTKAMEGCETAVHAVVGDERVILGTLEPVYKAAQACGVKRLVYLSTASVHGQSPEPGTTEDSPLHENHPLDYNNSKVRAERALLGLRKTGGVEAVLLRPGIVWGPRSRWVSSLAEDLEKGRAYFVNEGRGICNSIYVDNLVEAIRLALSAKVADAEAFLIGDEEALTWCDFYTPFAKAAGVDMNALPNLAPVEPRPPRKSPVEFVRGIPGSRNLLPLFPAKMKEVVKAAVGEWRRGPTPDGWVLPAKPPLQASLETSLLQQCAWRLPDAKARRMLGYRPVVSFAEGAERSIGWLKFAGYPIAG